MLRFNADCFRGNCAARYSRPFCYCCAARYPAHSRKSSGCEARRRPFCATICKSS